MIGGRLPRELVPFEALQAASAGWSGIMLLHDEFDPCEPVVVAVCAPASRLRRLQGSTLELITPRCPVHVDRPTLIVAIGSADGVDGWLDEMRIVLDLAFAESRRLLERAVEHGVLRLIWVPAEDGAVAEWETVHLSLAGKATLRWASARAAEWHTSDPLPLGIAAETWGETTLLAPRLLAASGRAPVVLVVPAPILGSTDGPAGQLEIGSGLLPPPDGHPGTADLQFRFAPHPASRGRSRSACLDLSSRDQRRLAERLADQTMVNVLGASPARDVPVANVRVMLGPAARRIIRLAASAARERR